MEGNYKNDNVTKINVIKVLARAASDPQYFSKLQDDPTGTLNGAGIKGGEFYIPNGRSLETISGILRCLGERKKTRN